MAEDLSSLLNLIAIAFGGNLATETFSIGGEDDRTYSASGIGAKAFGRQYGLNGHSRCEGDSSALREDFYLNNVRPFLDFDSPSRPHSPRRLPRERFDQRRLTTSSFQSHPILPAH
jgi:hypothetical protein